MFEKNVCPVLFSDAVKKYRLSDEFIKKFCGKGCSTDCGKFLKEELEKRERNEKDDNIQGQMSLEDFMEVMT